MTVTAGGIDSPYQLTGGGWWDSNRTGAINICSTANPVLPLASFATNLETAAPSFEPFDGIINIYLRLFVYRRCRL